MNSARARSATVGKRYMENPDHNDTRQQHVECLLLVVDRHNALWIGTEGNGIYRVHDGKVDRFRSADGLSSDSPDSFFEDREGNLWLITAEGVDCFRDIPVVNFSAHEGLTGDAVDSILAARDGTIWIGESFKFGLCAWGRRFIHRSKEWIAGSHVTSLFEDHAGRLWVGLDNGLFVYERGRFRPIQRRDGDSIGSSWGSPRMWIAAFGP